LHGYSLFELLLRLIIRRFAQHVRRFSTEGGTFFFFFFFRGSCSMATWQVGRERTFRPLLKRRLLIGDSTSCPLVEITAKMALDFQAAGLTFRNIGRRLPRTARTSRRSTSVVVCETVENPSGDIEANFENRLGNR